MPKQVITSGNSVPPLAPHSPGTRADGIIYISGCLTLDSAVTPVGTEDVPVRTKSVLDVIKGIFEAGGGTLADVTFETIFLKDLADNAAMSEIYKAYATIEPPARYCIQADLVRPYFCWRFLQSLTLSVIQCFGYGSQSAAIKTLR